MDNSIVKNRIKIKELYTHQRKGLTQPVSFALMATALSSCGGGGRSVLVGSDNGDNVITGTSGNDYIEVNKQNSIVTGNGGNDTFVFSDAASSSSTITDLSTGDVVITATPISATNVKNFVANSQTLIEWGIVLDIYPDDTGSFIDVSLINSNSGGQVNFRGGKGVDTLIGSKTQNNFYVSEAGIANSDTMDGGDDLDTIGLSHGSHTFSTDNNIRNIEYIRLSSFSQHPVSLDISAQTENFTIYGGSGIDTIISGSGDDIISGGAGDDIITGGAGSDTITGGTGSDTFVFLQSDGTSGADTITDFTAQAGDKLDLSSFGITTKSAALDTMTDYGSGNTQVAIDGDLIVTLNDISKSDLSGYEFIA